MPRKRSPLAPEQAAGSGHARYIEHPLRGTPAAVGVGAREERRAPWASPFPGGEEKRRKEKSKKHKQKGKRGNLFGHNADAAGKGKR